MSESKFGSSFRGIGLVGLLTILFVVLKLTNVIDWSWLWVLSPMWISAGLITMFLAILFGVAFGMYLGRVR